MKSHVRTAILDKFVEKRRTMMKLHLLLQAARQVWRRIARLRNAIAAERKDILVLNAPIRIQSRRKIGSLGKLSYICRRTTRQIRRQQVSY
jgi:hypothetical protein